MTKKSKAQRQTYEICLKRTQCKGGTHNPERGTRDKDTNSRHDRTPEGWGYDYGAADAQVCLGAAPAPPPFFFLCSLSHAVPSRIACPMWATNCPVRSI